MRPLDLVLLHTGVAAATQGKEEAQEARDRGQVSGLKARYLTLGLNTKHELPL